MVQELHKWQLLQFSVEMRSSISILLTCLLSIPIDSEFLMLRLSLDHITGPIYRILCLPYVVVLILGITKTTMLVSQKYLFSCVTGLIYLYVLFPVLESRHLASLSTPWMSMAQRFLRSVIAFLCAL